MSKIRYCLLLFLNLATSYLVAEEALPNLPSQHSESPTDQIINTSAEQDDLLIKALQAYSSQDAKHSIILNLDATHYGIYSHLYKNLEQNSKELNQGKKSDIKRFLQTNYRTEYIPSEMFDRGNPHLKKPVYMSQVVDWAYSAIARGDLKTTRILLDNYEFLLNIENDQGYGLLSYSILHSQNAIAYMLLQRGANLEQLNKYQASPLNIAARTNNTEAVKLLLDRGANTKQCDAFGKSSIDYAQMNQNEKMYFYLTSLS